MLKPWNWFALHIASMAVRSFFSNGCMWPSGNADPAAYSGNKTWNHRMLRVGKDVKVIQHQAFCITKSDAFGALWLLWLCFLSVALFCFLMIHPHLSGYETSYSQEDPRKFDFRPFLFCFSFIPHSSNCGEKDGQSLVYHRSGTALGKSSASW